MYIRISEYGKVKKGPNGVKKVQKYGVKFLKSQKGPKRVQKGSKGPKEAKRSKFLCLGPKKVQNGNPAVSSVAHCQRFPQMSAKFKYNSQ